MKIRILLAMVLCLGFLSGCSDEESEPQSNDNSTEKAAVTVADLKDSDFAEYITNGVVLVDFWATWCGPCQVQGPIVEAVAQQVQGKATVAKLDVDKSPATASKYQTDSIPTLIVFKDGEPFKRFVGVTDAAKLVAAIDDAQ